MNKRWSVWWNQNTVVLRCNTVRYKKLEEFLEEASSLNLLKVQRMFLFHLGQLNQWIKIKVLNKPALSILIQWRITNITNLIRSELVLLSKEIKRIHSLCLKSVKMERTKIWQSKRIVSFNSRWYSKRWNSNRYLRNNKLRRT